MIFQPSKTNEIEKISESTLLLPLLFTAIAIYCHCYNAAVAIVAAKIVLTSLQIPPFLGAFYPWAVAITNAIIATRFTIPHYRSYQHMAIIK